MSLLFLASSLKKAREKDAKTTRKLIGHSGPVYSLSFDPLNGSAAPPSYLLSGSADSTVRLWSMETMSNLVAYRGHQNPVWDVQWSPLGVYFATGSRDKTARLWSADRVSALRIYAGHLSDVDVSSYTDYTMLMNTYSLVHSALNSILILYISRLGLVIGPVGCGTYKRGPQCVSS